MSRRPGPPRVRRGRPPKYGRPAQLVSLTLPDDVLAWLKGLHPDPAWAIVKLFDRRQERTEPTAERAAAGLVQLPGRRALILVRPERFRGLHGVSLIPLEDGRAFLALDDNGGLAELEVALLDKSELPDTSPFERDQLREIRGQLKAWRHAGIKFVTGSIIVAQLSPAEGRQPRALGRLKAGRDPGPG